MGRDLGALKLVVMGSRWVVGGCGARGKSLAERWLTCLSWKGLCSGRDENAMG